MWPERALGWLEVAVKALVILAAVVAVPRYLYDVHQQRAEARLERSIALADTFAANPVADARRALRNFWLPYARRMHAARIYDIPRSARLDLLLKAEGNRTRGDRTIADEVDEIVLFLVRVDQCLSMDLCAPELLNQVFGHYLQVFMALHEPYISHRREVLNNPMFGIHLKQLCARLDACASAAQNRP